MTLLSPLTGLFVALAVIPPLIILYFLKLRRRPQAISTTLLWKRSIEDLRANAPFQKLRKSLLLLLQLIVLALLALSLMQPQIHAGSQKGGKTIMLIDNSGSMTARDAASGLTRLDEAKKRAKEKIEALYSGGLFASAGGETMIVVFSDRAEIYSRFTDSKQQLLAAIDRIQPTHGETKIVDAFKLARAYTTNVNPDQVDRPIADPATIELYSDGRIADVTDQVLRGEAMNYHAIGAEKADNVAIASISVERPYDRPAAVEVFTAVLNFNQEPVTCDVQLSVNDQARGIEGTHVPAAQINPATNELMPGRANVVFTPFDQPVGAVIEVANLREDDLAADNTAQIVVAPPKQLAVALVTEDIRRSVVKTVLEGVKLESLKPLAPADYEAMAERGELEQFDVVCFESYGPKKLPAAGGRFLSFGPTPPVEGFHEFGDGGQQVILAAKEEHPALRYVTHDQIFIFKFKQIQPAQDVQVLMEGSTGPAVLALSRGPLHLIHCPFDPLDSNWPLQRSWVNFVVNAVEYLGNAGQAITTRGLVPGEAITARLPTDATNIQLTTPDSAAPEALIPLDPAQLAWGPIRLAGLYVLNWKTGSSDQVQSRAFAVNLLSETEGNISVAPQMKLGQDVVAGRKSDESTYTPLWPWAVGICLAVLMLEWWVYHKKAYI